MDGKGGGPREVQCTGKLAYPSKAAALRVVRHLREPKVTAYRCEWCHQFHLGTRRTPHRQIKG